MNLLTRFWRFLWKKPNASPEWDAQMERRTLEQRGLRDGVVILDPPVTEYDTDLGPIQK